MAHTFFMEQSFAEMASDDTWASYRKNTSFGAIFSARLTHSSRTLVHIVLPDTSSLVKLNVGLYL